MTKTERRGGLRNVAEREREGKDLIVLATRRDQSERFQIERLGCCWWCFFFFFSHSVAAWQCRSVTIIGVQEDAGMRPKKCGFQFASFRPIFGNLRYSSSSQDGKVLDMTLLMERKYVAVVAKHGPNRSFASAAVA